MGCRHNGLSELWAVGVMGCRNNATLPSFIGEETGVPVASH